MKKTKNKEINRKLVVVGDGYCGKTTLIASFYNRKFIDKYEPTIFDTFSIQTEIYKRQVNLEICDSAGQEEFSRVRPLSYPEVDAIILCFSIDSRESSQNLVELWLPEIRHYCSNKVPIVLVGCKIDLRLDRAPTSINRHFLLKQEHLNHQNSLSNLNRINLSHPQPNQLNKTISSLHYGHFKTLALYCCRHGRLCTCYHSRICATNCIDNIKRKANQLSSLSNSSSCLLTASTPKHGLCKDNVIRCNRVLLKQQSPTRNSTRNSTNTEDSFSGSEDAELQSNTLSNSSCSLNGQDKSTFSNTYSNSIYRHNQSMLNTLIHQQIEQQQCANSLNSSESEESEVAEQLPEDDHIHEDSHEDNVQACDYEDAVESHFNIADNLHLDLSNRPADHLQSSLEEAGSKSQPLLIKNLKFSNRSKLLRGYRSFSNADNNNNRPSNNKVNLDLSKKDSKVPKSSSLKQKLSTILGVKSSYSDVNSSSIYSPKSEKKLSNLFYNRKLSDTSLPLSFIYKTNADPEPQSPFITTEEGIKLCAKIGASAYVECSSKMNIGVDEVFRTAIKLSIKNPIMKFQQLDMCSLS